MFRQNHRARDFAADEGMLMLGPQMGLPRRTVGKPSSRPHKEGGGPDDDDGYRSMYTSKGLNIHLKNMRRMFGMLLYGKQTILARRKELLPNVLDMPALHTTLLQRKFRSAILIKT